MENYLHPDAIRAAKRIDVDFGDFDDVPERVARVVHENSESGKAWTELETDDRKKKESRAKLWLNTEAVAKMTPAMLDERDPQGDVRRWLMVIGGYLTA